MVTSLLSGVHLGTGDGQFNRPDGILFDGSEKLIYVTDRKNNRIQAFNADGQFVSKWKTLDAQTGTSIKPRDIALGSSDEAYIVDKENSDILIYKLSEHHFVYHIRSHGEK